MSQIATVDCGTLAIVQATADRIWADPIAQADYKGNVNAALAVLQNQRVNFGEITGVKDKSISVEWESLCSLTPTTCSDDCTPSGTEISPTCVTYSLDTCQEVSFEINEKSYRSRTITKEEAIAKSMLLAKKAMDEYIAQAIVTGLVANAGTNEFTGGIGTVSGTSTYILPAYWTASMFGYYAQVGLYNRFTSPYLIDGNNLWQVIWDAGMKTGAPELGVAYKMVNSMKVYQDPLNVEAIAPGVTFMLHNNAVAYVHKTYYPLGAANAIQKAGNYFLWSEPSMNIPGINYDIIYREDCTSNEFTGTFTVQLNSGFFVNPVGCTAARTGILQFECGTVPLA